MFWVRGWVDREADQAQSGVGPAQQRPKPKPDPRADQQDLGLSDSTPEIMGTDPSSLGVAAHNGVRGQKSPHSQFCSSLHLPCPGYSTGNPPCLFQHE